MCDIKYKNSNYNFAYRVSALIFNKEKTQILLFYGNDTNFYMLPGGKVKELEKSNEAIKREIQEEIGWKDLKFDFIGVSEEIVKSNKENIQELTLTYKSIYDGKILDKTFKGIESDWINFEWVKIEEIDKYEIHPTKIKDFIKNEKQTNHIIEEIID